MIKRLSREVSVGSAMRTDSTEWARRCTPERPGSNQSSSMQSPSRIPLRGRIQRVRLQSNNQGGRARWVGATEQPRRTKSTAVREFPSRTVSNAPHFCVLFFGPLRQCSLSSGLGYEIGSADHRISRRRARRPGRSAPARCLDSGQCWAISKRDAR